MSTAESLSIEYWVEKLSLLPHPEGGFYRQTYLSADQLTALPDRYAGPRAAGSAIYFMVTAAAFSAFHRLRTDEVWHFYTGPGALRLHIIEPDGHYRYQDLGSNPAHGQVFQTVVPFGCWFAAEMVEANGFALAGCTLAPAFDFADFELANRQALQAAFPQHHALISRLTRV